MYAPNEEAAIERLELVFTRLRAHGLKLAPKKCHFLRRSVKFLGHVIDETGVAIDPDKVSAISAISESDLMMPDGVTPSQKKIRSFLGYYQIPKVLSKVIFLYYQNFIQNCSSIAKPLFTLTAAPRGKKTTVRGAASFRRLNPSDWKHEHSVAFQKLKTALLESVVLAHPDFSQPFILCTDDSTLSRVLFYVSRGWKPSRRERTGETHKVIKTLKQWEKFKMLDGILYRVSKDVLTRKGDCSLLFRVRW